MKNIREVQFQMVQSPEYWRIPFMEFVDDFRKSKDIRLIEQPFQCEHERFDALLASTIESLCAELGIETPNWVWEVPSCKYPWFVSGIREFKRSPLLKILYISSRRKIFVLENFLERA